MCVLMQTIGHKPEASDHKPEASDHKLVRVAVGVIIDADGKILIAKRNVNTHQGNLWEFPGGKIEQGETLFQALKRELHEELAIDILATEPLIKIRHDYADKSVLLDVHKVTRFTGVAQGNEGQPICWVKPTELNQFEFPAANRTIIHAINLPQRFLITGAAASENEYLERTEQALKKGIRLVQLRMQNSSASFFFEVAEQLTILCQRYSAQLVLNTSPQAFLFASDSSPFLKSAGLHLNSHQLMACESRPVASHILLGASCHNAVEIAQAKKINADYICVSPVAVTSSHPEAAAIGWETFSYLVEPAVMPVFALGGMCDKDLPKALESGAQGIAAIGAWWPN
jgi:8-oxo-dGTP diphosphatase